MGSIRQWASNRRRRIAEFADKLLDKEKIGSIYGAEELVLQVTPDRKEERKAICYRIDEVRLYAKVLG